MYVRFKQLKHWRALARIGNPPFTAVPQAKKHLPFWSDVICLALTQHTEQSLGLIGVVLLQQHVAFFERLLIAPLTSPCYCCPGAQSVVESALANIPELRNANLFQHKQTMYVQHST